MLLADLVTRPSRSVIRQSFNARERIEGTLDPETPFLARFLNGDGFGIGWYPPSGQAPVDEKTAHPDVSPCVFTELKPAWNSQNLSRLAQKTVSPLFFAHVRAAGPGMPVNENCCHPMQCGRYLFMHNGGIGGFRLIFRALMATLDELSFDWLMSAGEIRPHPSSSLWCSPLLRFSVPFPQDAAETTRLATAYFVALHCSRCHRRVPWTCCAGAITDSILAFAMFLSLLHGDVHSRRRPEDLMQKLETVIKVVEAVSKEHHIGQVCSPQLASERLSDSIGQQHRCRC